METAKKILGTIFGFLGDATLRRFVAWGVGIACVALNAKLGLQISETGQAEIVALVMLYVGQSTARQHLAEKLAATAPPPVASIADAIAIANSGPK